MCSWIFLRVSPALKQFNEHEAYFGSPQLIEIRKAMTGRSLTVRRMPARVSDEQEEEGIGSGAGL